MDTTTNDQWTEGDSMDFIKYSQFFVPDREIQIQTIIALIPEDTDDACIVDICCGEGLLLKTILEAMPRAKVIATDGSDDMLKKTDEHLSPFQDRYQTKKIDIFRDDWRRFDQPIKAFISSLAIHHLDSAGKEELFKDLYHELESGGALIIADLIKPENNYGKRLAAKNWNKAVMQRSLQYKGDLSGFEAFQRMAWNSFTDPDFESDPIDRPSTLREQLAWLEAAGFEMVDVFWMNAGHAIFGGYKK